MISDELWWKIEKAVLAAKIILALIAIIGFSLICILAVAQARGAGQWEATDGQVREWFRSLMQPDNPRISCCGEADSYWADSYIVRDGMTVAIITDVRDDAKLGRPHLEAGTHIPVPNHKMKFDAGNPTGHGIIFITSSHQVLCYLTPGGI